MKTSTIARLLMSFLLALPLHPAWADEAPSLSVSFYKKLSEAQNWLQKKHTENSRAILQKLTEQANNSAYENGLVWKALGYLHYQNGDYKQAIQAFEKALQFDIPAVLAQDVRKLLGQVYLSDGQYQKAAQHLSRWFDSATAEQQAGAEDVRLWLAQCYYQLKQYQKVVVQLTAIIRQYEAENRQPREEWLSLLQASLAQMDAVQERVNTIKRLLVWYPKAEYWLALASAYGQMDKMDNYLATLSLARQKDLLQSESQYLSLASVFFSRDVPIQAAAVMEEGLRRNIISANAKNLRFLAACYTQAQEFEKALVPLQQAAGKTEGGETDAMLGNAYFQLARWQESADALETAIQKGQLKQLTTVWLLLGQAYLNQQQYERAVYAFRQASQDEERANQAQQWIQYAEYEKKRHEELGLIKSPAAASKESSS
ncbi:MAG: tetratricopeptide repeat protein [Gammaproteobacteria bacterium]|nr:tetratricopeptide repeat protein [Gammaproteobacteria bacterium]